MIDASEPVGSSPSPASRETQADIEFSTSFPAVIKLAIPLVLSMTGHTVMMILDGLFLSWHSDKDIAALGVSSMATWAIMSLFLGPAGYTSTFVAQYFGAKRPHRIGPVVWQGLILAAGAGGLLALASFATPWAFSVSGHDPEILSREVIYFRIMCLGAVFPLVIAATSGYFSGLGRTRTLMVVHLIGFTINGVLDYALVFGRFGFAPHGIAGAAIATVIAQAFVAVTFAVLFLVGRDRRAHATRQWRLEPGLLRRLLRFGFPHGLRFFVEALGWTGFVMFVGRLGQTELAATSIAFRINTIAFFPMLGLSMAASILVGQSQGRKRADLAERGAWRCLLIAEIWMVAAAGAFLLIPGHLLGLFHDPKNVSPERFAEIAAAGVVLLRFVAVYSVVDALNVVILGALQGAGDTRWTILATIVLYAMFGVALVVMDVLGAGLYAEWTAATLFVISMALTWLARFRGGAWKSMRVIEPALDDVPASSPAA
jgi:MATE family multidrug resistance protein